MNDQNKSTDLVAELRADVVVPYKANYTPLRAPPSKLMLRAAAEIERVTADFQQVHHNCIHAREVADKALALLKSVHVEQMPLSWQADLAAVIELARNVPPLHPDVAPEPAKCRHNMNAATCDTCFALGER